MNEEIRDSGAELNDAALEQVSGGVRESSLAQARHICETCPARGVTGSDGRHCEGGAEQLAEYLESERFPISHWAHCPYLKT